MFFLSLGKPNFYSYLFLQEFEMADYIFNF